MQSGDLVERVSPGGQKIKTTKGYFAWYNIVLLSLSMLLVLVLGGAVFVAAYVQDVTPLIAASVILLVIVVLMVVCIFFRSKSKRPA